MNAKTIIASGDLSDWLIINYPDCVKDASKQLIAMIQARVGYHPDYELMWTEFQDPESRRIYYTITLEHR